MSEMPWWSLAVIAMAGVSTGWLLPSIARLIDALAERVRKGGKSGAP